MPVSHKKSPYALRVGRSSAGLGLFTKDPIPKGAFIVEYFGPMLTDKQADNKGGKYLFEIKKDHIIDGTSRKNIARYINHSCRPNCEPETPNKRVLIYATKNIKAGEELTYDYGDEYFDDIIEPHGCKCAPCNKKAPRKKRSA